MSGAAGRARVIRRARAGDMARLAALHVHCWRESYAGILPTVRLASMSETRERARFAHALHERPERQATLVAEAPGHGVVGYGQCGPAREGVRGYEGEVFTLYVHPEHQGHGHGRLLLRALLRELSRHGRRSAIVWALSGNPNRFFYRAAGAVPVAHRPLRMWGAELIEEAQGWPDIEAALRLPALAPGQSEDGGV